MTRRDSNHFIESGNLSENAIRRIRSHDSVSEPICDATATDPAQAQSPEVAGIRHASLDDSELRRILIDFNDTHGDYPRDKCLHQLFEDQASRSPDAIAVRFGGASLTYQELNHRSNRLAAHLLGLGVGPEVLVGLCLDRSLEMVVAMFGILKAGGAYVPLDPSYPADRLAFMLKDSGAPVLIGRKGLADSFNHAGHRVDIDADREIILRQPQTNPTTSVAPHNLAYAIYTSGSTGRPKGVLLEHGNAVSFVAWFLTIVSARELAGVAAVTSISFDLSIIEIFVTLAGGGTIILVENALALSAGQTDVTTLSTVPSAVATALEIQCIPASVRTIMMGGEPVPQPLVDRLCRETPATRILDLYGPTETTTYSTWFQRSEGGIHSIGRPITNTQIYILDEDLQPVPIGAVGEICIAGAGVARGYLNRPDLTAQKFVPNPFWAPDSPPGTGSRIYRSGDMGSFLPDGNIVPHGRVDFQVKIRGFRVELGEIETQLARYPGLAQVAVTTHEDDAGDRRIHAYFVASDRTAPPDPQRLRAFLGEKLPYYMIPSAFVALDQMPRTQNGKIDRKAMPIPGALDALSPEPVAPSPEPVMDEAQRRRILFDFNDTRRDYPHDQCLHQIIEDQAARQPNAVAIRFGDASLTYEELNLRSNRLAHHLLGLGVGPEVFVGLCLDRSLEMVVGMLAILKAGGAYVPMDPAYPADRLVYMLKDSGAPVLITRKGLDHSLEFSGHRVDIDADREIIRRQPQTNPVTSVAPHNLAYVIYTSGSTGRPKGVLLEHGNSVSFVTSTLTFVSSRELAGVAAVASIAFDFSTIEIFVTLVGGGTIILFENALALRADRTDVTLLSTVPSAVATALEIQCLPSSIQTFMMGGEPVPQSLVDRLYRETRATRIVDIYGPTEISTYTTWFDRTEGGIHSIGRPIPNTQVYILDEALRPVPIGVVGEICVAGVGVARGYLNQPDLTARKFVPNPFKTPDSPAGTGPRIYRTGDMGCFLPDGNIVSHGRIDHQVKIRGFRVELGEIENQLAGYPGLAHVAVTTHEDETGDRRIYAYTVASDRAAAPDPQHLRAFLAEKLPAYMVPAAFVALDQMPRTQNGKVDRKALPLPGNSNGSSSSPGFAGTDHDSSADDSDAATQQLILQVFRQVLRLPRLGPRDDFFAAGGHSLLAAQVAARVGRALGIELPLRTVFEAKTAVALARAIPTLGIGSRTEIPPISRIPRDGPLTPSFGQSRMWFIDKFMTGKPVYNVHLAVRLTGSLNLEHLRRSLNEIVARHEVLRTTYKTIEGEPWQVIAPTLAVELPVTDLSHVPPDRQFAAVRRLTLEGADIPYDLERGPIIRFGLLRQSDREHVLIVGLHHIAFDGWSNGVFFNELQAIYRAYCAGEASPLPPLEVQYADFAHWQRQWMTPQFIEEHLAYWRKQLDGAQTLIDLPSDRPRPSLLGFDGASEPFAFPGALALKELARREGVTLFMILLAGFEILLSRHTGQRDFIIGSPIAGRHRGDVESLIGLFINTLPLRADLSGNPTVRELLARVRDVALGAYAHQDTPLEKIVDDIKPARSSSHDPLIQVLMVLQNAPKMDAQLADLDMRVFNISGSNSRMDLTLWLDESDEGITGHLEYRTDLFDARTIQLLLRRFGRVLESMAADPGQTIGRLPLIDEAERRQLMETWNDTTVDFGGDPCVHQLFEAQARSTPDAAAICFEERTLTYAQLDARAKLLAHHLQRLGVGPDVLVGICVDRSLDMIVGLLGILKAGGAYVPLDPDYPKERLRFMLGDTRAPVLLTQSHLRDQLPNHSARVICLDEDWGQIESEDPDPRERLESPARADNLAYVIYTSGSTGQPKGVAMPHGPLVNLIHWHLAQPRREHGRRTLQFTTLSFDVAFQEIFATLCAGGELVLISADTRRDLDSFPDLLARKGITRLFLPFVALEQLAETCQLRNLFPASLREIITAGEQLRITPSISRLLTQLPECRLHNHYGPTESHVVTTFSLPAPLDGSTLPPIGRPISNVQIHILDEFKAPVPIGVAGELHIGGACLARGYLNRPELTAEKFVANPFGGPGSRLYRTGDLARYLGDGNIEFLGRIDHQVKIRGFRIELGEIESMLGQFPGVRQCAVSVREDVPGDKRAVAYVVFDGSRERTDTARLREFLKQRLPEYMVPAAYVTLESLPTTPTGKVDRKALPAPDTNRPDLDQPYTPPGNAVEELLVEIFQEALNVDRVGIHDSFFDLGGHSLMAAQVAAKVGRALSIDLPLRTIFEARTISALAQRIPALPVRAQIPSITRIDRANALTPSFGQNRMWVMDKVIGDKGVYNIPLVVRLTGELNVDCLRRALNQIVERHETLRTTFISVNGEPQVRIAPSLILDLPVIEIGRGLEADQARQAVDRHARVEASRTFDLAQGPLVRAQLVRVDERNHVLLLTAHHIVSDGWSSAVLLEELQLNYRSIRTGEASTLKPMTVQYVDFADWQRRVLTSKVVDEHLAYWRTQLAGAPELIELPTDRPRPVIRSYDGDMVGLKISAELTMALGALAQRQGATLFMTLLAGLEIVLSRCTGQRDFVVGSPVAGRHQGEVEHLVGLFANTIPIRCDVSGDPTVSQILARVRDASLEAFSHQYVPFEKIVDLIKPRRSTGYDPVVQVLIALQNAPKALVHLPELEMKFLNIQGNTARVDITLILDETDDGIEGFFEYRTDLFDADTIERMSRYFLRTLEAIAADPKKPISQIRLMDKEEERQLLIGFNDTARPYPRDSTIHGVFEEQASRAPAAVAVTFRDESLTYEKLNRRSNQLARYLRKTGVGPDVPVGIMVEPSLETVVGLLGILKAGGAYVPLDPSYPAERLAFMLDDTRTPVLLTQRRLVQSLPPHEARVVCLDDQWSDIAAESDENLDVKIDAGNLAYIIYTSGSTGRPKGVEVPHRGVLRLVLGAEFATFGSDRVFLQLAPISFDASTLELWGPLPHGGRCAMFHERVPSPAMLGQFLKSQGVTTLWLTSSLFNAIVDDDPTALSSVKELLIGGEALSVRHVRRALAALPDTRIINGYGPTESTTFTCCHPIPRDLSADAPSVPIGRPISNTQVYILDDAMRPVPIGVAGELYIGGDGLARGYLRRPELTTEKFVANPYGPSGSRLYRTGDLTRWKRDGTVEFLGRMDQQVKIRGFRIELGEIESVLGQCPGVGQCAVVPVKSPTEDLVLVAYLVPAEGTSLDIDAARLFLNQKLPRYMVPSSFVVIPSMPLSPSGKADRKALANIAVERPAQSDEGATPLTNDQEVLASIYCDLLKLDHVGIHDDFFQLGGHSLLALQLSARAESALEVTIPLATIFSNPTIAQLAQQLAGGKRIKAPTSIVLRSGRSRPPLFMLPGLAGHAIGLRDLALRLPPDQPAFGLQTRGLDGLEEPIETLPEMAEHLIAELRRLKPTGPYYFVGWSAGCLTAFEMAQQLRRSGEQIGCLILIDGWAPGRRRLAFDLIWHALDVWNRPLNQVPSHIGSLISRRFRKNQNAAEAFPENVDPIGGTVLKAARKVAKVQNRAMMNYKWSKYDGPALLVSSTERRRLPGNLMDDPSGGWSQVIQDLKVIEMQGKHTDLLNRTNIKILGKYVQTWLSEAQRKFSPESGNE